jgi:hypothetical protein
MTLTVGSSVGGAAGSEAPSKERAEYDSYGIQRQISMTLFVYKAIGLC